MNRHGAKIELWDNLKGLFARKKDGDLKSHHTHVLWLRLFPGCADYQLRNTPLDLRIEERVVEIVRARGCGIMKKDLGQR